MSAKPFPLPILIDLLRERIEVAKQYEKVARIGCLGELLEQAVPQLERLHRLDVAAQKPAPELSLWQILRDNWRRRRAERNDQRVLSGETLVRELGRMAR